MTSELTKEDFLNQKKKTLIFFLNAMHSEAWGRGQM